LVLLRGEFVSFAQDSDNKARGLGIGLDLSPQSPNENVDTAIIRLGSAASRCIKQLVARQHPAGAACERQE